MLFGYRVGDLGVSSQQYTQFVALAVLRLKLINVWPVEDKLIDN
jgi:hypothetical protein